MANLLTNFGFLASENHFLAYFFLYAAIIFLGNVAAFVGFWLVMNNYLGPSGIFYFIFVFFMADASGDLLWYSLGRALRDTRVGNFIKNHLPHHQKIEDHLQKNSRRWMMLSKFIYASTFPIVFLIGWTKVDFPKFFKYSLTAIIIWIPVFLVVSYGLISSLSFFGAADLFKKVEIVFLIGLFLFVIINRILTWLMGKIFDSRV